MNKYGYVDVFPTRIHKIKLDTKLIPNITFDDENHSKSFGFVDILHTSKEISYNRYRC